MREVDLNSRLLETNLETPILDFYKGIFTECFVILHPFYKEIFASHYNEQLHFKLTYPLMERISWAHILKLTSIKNNAQLALTITYPACNDHFRRMVKGEWNEFHPFLKENHILEPFWDADKIPEDIILPFLELLLEKGYTGIHVGYWPKFADDKMEFISLTEENKFDNALQLTALNFIYTSDGKYCIKLPYHDLPYTFLLTNGASVNEIATKLNYEGFAANPKTKVYWHIE